MIRRSLLVAFLASSAAGCASNAHANHPDNAGGGADSGSGQGGTSPLAGGAGASGGNASGGSAGASMASAPWDWNGVIGTGQSLSIGETAAFLNLTQPFHNLKLSLGSAVLKNPPYNAAEPTLSMVPLVEPIRTPPSSTVGYPVNIHGETPHTAMGNQLSWLYQQAMPGQDLVSVHTVVGESGQGITIISKGATPTDNNGHAYAATLFEVTAIKRLAAAAGKTYGVGAIILTHGESDWGDQAYDQDVYRLYQDYNVDIPAITGQTGKIPMLLTQQETYPATDGTELLPPSTLKQWQVGDEHPGEVICVGPKYQYTYSRDQNPASDRLHLPGHEYDRLGEKYAEVYYEVVVQGHDWRPLEPLSATLSGLVISVPFHVPVGPMMWDDNLPAPHQGTVHTEWKNGRGFEVEDEHGALTIASVAIQGDSVLVTLASAPTSTTNLFVRYAAKPDLIGPQGGTADGRIGQLSDSDPFVAYDRLKISCQVTQGSTTVTGTGLEVRGPRDLAIGASLAPNTAVVSVASGSAVLSQPWTGPSGVAELTFQTNQRNFAVSFEMAVH